MPDVCAIDECTAPVGNRGWCNAHYSRWKRHGDPLAGRGKAVQREGHREYVIGEVEWLKSFGVSPELILSTLNYKRDSIRVSLRRWGRDDLADLFNLPKEEKDWAREYMERRTPAA